MKIIWLKRVLIGCTLLLFLAIPSKTEAGGIIGRAVAIAASTEHDVTPAVAYNSTRQEYLVVWSTDRTKCDGIWGQFVSKGGKVLGSAIAISIDCPERRYPDVAYDSLHDQYLVVWEQYEEGFGYSIQGRRIDGSGKVLDATDIVIRGPELKLYTPSKPAVAYAVTSDYYLVVWAETELNLNPITYMIIGARMTDAGTIVSELFTISLGNTRREEPDLAYNHNTNRYLVVWQQQDGAYWDIYGQQVPAGDNLYGSNFTIASFAQLSTAPAVAAVATSPTVNKFLVVYELLFTANDRDILGQFVAEDGTMPDAHFWISGTPAVEETSPAIASTEGNRQYYVTWRHDGAASDFIKGRAISYSGVGGWVSEFSGTAANYPAIAGGPVGDFLVAWQDQPPSAASLNIYGQLWGNRVYLPVMKR